MIAYLTQVTILVTYTVIEVTIACLLLHIVRTQCRLSLHII